MSAVTEVAGRKRGGSETFSAVEVTIVELFGQQVERQGARPALRHSVGGSWQPLTWAAYGDAVREIAAGLIDIGVAPGDRVALLSTNRVEWHFADLGILSGAAVTVPVYPTSAASQVAYIVNHCDASGTRRGLSSRQDPRRASGAASSSAWSSSTTPPPRWTIRSF
jgi:long-subunit acyl-CoA synthetase (AMP-forming)